MYKNLQDKLLEKALIIRNKSQNSKCFSYPVITTCAIKKVIDENVGTRQAKLSKSDGIGYGWGKQCTVSLMKRSFWKVGQQKDGWINGRNDKYRGISNAQSKMNRTYNCT